MKEYDSISLKNRFPLQQKKEKPHTTFAFSNYSVILHYNTTRESFTLVRTKMMNLLPHHRFHIPNGLAIFAAVLLLISSIVGFEARQKVYSPAQETLTTSKVDHAESGTLSDATKHKSRGLKLGLLLFRRG